LQGSEELFSVEPLALNGSGAAGRLSNEAAIISGVMSIEEAGRTLGVAASVARARAAAMELDDTDGGDGKDAIMSNCKPHLTPNRPAIPFANRKKCFRESFQFSMVTI